jgi:hypothetical protein
MLVGKPEAKKIIALFILVSLVATCFYQLSSPYISASPTQTGVNGKSDGVGGVQGSFSSDQYDPVASPRPVNESAVGFDSAGGSGRTVNLPSTGTTDLPVTLDYGWSINKVTATVLGLWDQRNWVSSGTFNTGTNTPYPPTSGPWTFRRWYDVNPTGDAYVDTGNWVSSGKYVNVSMPWLPLHSIGNPPGSRQYYYMEYSTWNETFTVPRGTVLAANLTLAYHPNYVPQLAYSDFKVFVQINSHIVWWRDFAAMNATERNRWTVRSLNVFTDLNGSYVFNTPAQQTMKIAVGVIYTGPSGWYWDGLAVSQNGCWFDNVTLALKALARPDQVQLKIKEPVSGVSANVATSDYGSGSAVLTGFTVGPAPSQAVYYFGFTSNVTLPATGSFRSNATIYVFRLKTAATLFSNTGNNLQWSVSLVTAFQSSGQQFSTTSYTKYYFNVSVPSDWTLTTCQDPSGHQHSILSEANNFTRVVFGSKAVLRVNVTRIGSYSLPASFPPYVINANSTNYIKSLWTQLQSGPTWVNKTNFYPQQTAKFVAYVKGSSPVSSGVANLTIRGPPTYGASPVVIETITGVAPINGFANFTKLLPNSYAAGNYSAQVDWVDNQLGEAGSLTCKFNVTHTFQMSIAVPAAGDVIVKGTVLLNPPASISLRDFYTGQFVTADVKARASWESVGRWDSLTTYSVANATYTNMTSVPLSLTIGSRAWLAANASKPFYDKGTANSTFWIGSAATVGTQTAINIYYTETNTFSVKLDQISYQEAGSGNPITNATVSLSSSISSNDTLVKWSVRFSADYSQQGSGKYSGWIYIGTLSPSAKAIPPGTYTVWFKLSQGQYIETKFFSLQLTIFPAPSYLDHVSGSGQYIFWGQTALIKLNFTTYWSYGSYSLPRTPITNDSSPYVGVICGWSGGWSATHLVLDPDGMYTLYIDTTSFATPTPDGNGAGQTTFNVKFNKTSYNLSNIVPVTLHIMRLTTSMTGAVMNGAVYASTNTTSVYPGDYKSIFVWYNDTHTGIPVGVVGASVTYSSLALGSGTLSAVAGVPGLYNLTLSGTSTNQIPGPYTITLTGTSDPHYVQRIITVTLNVLPIPSALQLYNPPATIYYLDRVVYLIWYNDTHNGVPISGATISVSAPGVTIVAPSEVLGTPGLYNLTIPAGQAVGDYNINVGTNKTKYADGSTLIHLHITSLPSVVSTYSIVSTGSPVIGPSVTVPLGEPFTIYLWFNDTYHGTPIPGMENYITYTSSEFGHSWVTPVAGTPGLYKVVIANTPDAGIFTITFQTSANGYAPQTLDFTVTVQSPPPGFSLFTVMLVGAGGGGVVLVGVVALLFMRRARIPFVIKKIDESLKLIGNGDHEAATPVALRSREELVVGITQDRVDAFLTKKPAKGEAAAALAEEAPVTGESAALKTELEAVETKEKPGEAVEEVEMNTLDEELQKLEKSEDKEKLPEGAKEVRDVIEKYKKGKKKEE